MTIPIRRYLLLLALTGAAACGPNNAGKNAMTRQATLARDAFGVTPDGKQVDLYTLTNANGIEVRVMTYGATIVSLKTPDKDSVMGDIVLGYDSLAGYIANSPYFGAVVGRYGNRIAKGRFTLDGKTYQLAINNGPNALHGGIKGFDKVVWQGDPVRTDSTVGVAMTYVSADGEEGYPGTLTARVTYSLDNHDKLTVSYEASTDKATPINLTQHTYWNLGGAGSGDILSHVLTINADSFTPVDTTLIPTGQIAPVEGTPFDFRTGHAIGQRIEADNQQLRFGGGYDHNFVLNRDSTEGLVKAARVVDTGTGRTLEIFTTEPGIQFYSGNYLDGTITGKGGRVYVHRGALCLETQHYPDSPNHKNFPSTILKPGERWQSETQFVFGVVR
jgi:aldose 1-epimerase